MSVQSWLARLLRGTVCVQAEDGIRDLVRSRGLGDVYKRQRLAQPEFAQAYYDVAIYGPGLQAQADFTTFDGSNPILAGLRDLVTNGTPPAYPDVYNTAYGEISANFLIPRMVQRVVIDGYEFQAAIDEAHAAAQAIYDKYKEVQGTAARGGTRQRRAARPRAPGCRRAARRPLEPADAVVEAALQRLADAFDRRVDVAGQDQDRVVGAVPALEPVLDVVEGRGGEVVHRSDGGSVVRGTLR